MNPILFQSMRFRVLTCAAFALWLTFGGAAKCIAADDKDAEFFAKRIQPVLKKNCYDCHSAEADELKGELRLDTPEGITKGGNNGPIVKPGDLEDSFLLRVIRYQEDDYQMPPRGKMADKVIEDFEAWVKAGAIMPKKK